MSEFSDVIKVIIDKGGFKTFLFSVAVAIISQKLWLNDWLWSVVVFCGCFLLVSFIVWVKSRYDSAVYEDKKEKQAEEARIAQYKRFCIVYNSLTPMTQQNLIELYKLPMQGYSNVRILNDMYAHCNILQSCRNLQLKDHTMIKVEDNFGTTYTIYINDVFCKVLAEHISDFE
jgi:hypothetical protein